jgi:long-chain acyl-CoA synthetase
MTLELDLGFDSLARVELLGLLESRLGMQIPEQDAARIFTLGELVEAFEKSRSTGGTDVAGNRSWKDILAAAPADAAEAHYIFKPRALLNPVAFVIMRVIKLLTRALFGFRYYGLEKLPRRMPFLMCPNHQSFLDGPFLVSILPRRVIYKMFILGYSDYWKTAFSRFVAQICNIVAIDPSVNLVRAMQVGAVGLKSGRALLIFPEGTRTIDGHVAEFKKGAAILACELGVPIVPIGLRGAFEVWPRGGRFRFHPIEIHFGDPIDPQAFVATADPYSAITEKLFREVKKLSGDDLM